MFLKILIARRLYPLVWFATYSVASFAVFPRNWASFDEALREKFSSRGSRLYGLFFAIPFRYFGLVFGVTRSVKV